MTFALTVRPTSPPFSRAISLRNAATVRRSSAASSNCFTTKLLSSAGESASMSGGRDILPSSQKTADLTIFPSPMSQLTAPTPMLALARQTVRKLPEFGVKQREERAVRESERWASSAA